METASLLDELKPCPFCGGGETHIRPRHMPPRMSGPGELISIDIIHWCPRLEGQLSRTSVTFAGREWEPARDAWNRRANG